MNIGAFSVLSAEMLYDTSGGCRAKADGATPWILYFMDLDMTEMI